MNTVTIGILGGMGPRATIAFEQRLIGGLLGIDQAVPKIVVVNDGSIPDRSTFLLGGGQDPLPKLVELATHLTEIKPDIVCMPCNTAHSPKILARLMALQPLPIIDMPASCILQAESLSYRRALILGTAGTAATKVFDERAVSLACIYPDTAGQKTIDTIIRTLKKGQDCNHQLQRDLRRIIAASTADVCILACTELSLLEKTLFTALPPVIDSMDVLAAQCITLVKRYTNSKGDL